MTTGYVWLERYGWHDTGTLAGFIPSGPTVQPYQHIESADSKVRLASIIEVSGLGDHLHRIPVAPATEADVLRVHDREYVQRIQELSTNVHGGGLDDPGTVFGQGAYELALLAAGGTMSAVGAVLTGKVQNAYALVRPPGHHAEPQQGMGFCIFGNIAVAIHWARAELGLRRVAVVDWDVHHGNGTQKIFYSDPDTLTVSLHQDSLYPFRSGPITDRGEGDGVGAALNIPLPAGSGNGAYLAAMERVVVPALRAFRPELIIVGSGFDSSAYDPLGGMLVTVAGYRALSTALLDVAAEVCDGRVVMSHEGGYSPFYVPYCGLAVIETMAGIRTGFDDPIGWQLDELPDQLLQPHQEKVIETARALLEVHHRTTAIS
jgi:acetoin utilization deacetylase AcuC-like enzyme